METGRRLTRSITKAIHEESDSFYSPPKKKLKSTPKQATKSISNKAKRAHKNVNFKEAKARGKKTSPKQPLFTSKHDISYHLTTSETFNIRSRSDENICTIYSMCMLDSGDILIADYKNPVLKQINGDTYEIRNTLELKSTAVSVCKINGTEAVIALSNKSLQFVSTLNKLVPTRTLKMNHTCLGVCVISDKIYINCGDNRNLFVYDMDGTILKRVDGQNIFAWNRFVTGSDDGNAIYITDRDEGVIKMDRNGEVIWKWKDPTIAAFGVDTDGLGNVFVSGYASNNVVQISSDGHCLGEIVPSRICIPMTAGLCFDRQKSKLFVAGYTCDEVSVYCFKRQNMETGRRLTRSKSKAIQKEGDSSCSPPKKKLKSTPSEAKKSTSNKAKRSHKNVNFKQTKAKEKKTSPKQRSSTSEHDILYQLTTRETFSIKSPSDQNECTIWSMCMLDSGDILIADSGNPVLKQMNGDTYKIRNTLKLQTSPYSVCKVNATEAIVALSNNSLQFVSTLNKLLPTRTLKMNHTCLGVCVISDSIYITSGAGRQLFVYDMDGTILKTVEGQNIFSWNRFIVESDDGNAIYITDKDEGLIKMDKNGEVIWKCKISLIGAFGVGTDGLGNVFVSGYDSKNVVQISSDGQCLGEIVPSRICIPSTAGLCFDRQKSKLFVAGYTCNEVSVYCFK